MSDEKYIRALIVGHSLAAGIAGIPDAEASEKAGGRRRWVPVVKALGEERSARVFGGIPARLDVAVKVGSGIQFAQEQLGKKKPGQYDVIIIFTGGNDVRTRKPAALIAQELEKLYETAKTRLAAKKVLIFNFPLPEPVTSPVKAKVKKLNDLMRSSGKIPAADIIDFSEHPMLAAALHNWPRRHPPEETYRMIRSAVRDIVGEWREAQRPKMHAVPRKVASEEKKGEARKIPL